MPRFIITYKFPFTMEVPLVSVEDLTDIILPTIIKMFKEENPKLIEYREFDYDMDNEFDDLENPLVENATFITLTQHFQNEVNIDDTGNMSSAILKEVIKQFESGIMFLDSCSERKYNGKHEWWLFFENKF